MPHDEVATIYSVAERARVSIATVSRVLSGADRVSPASRDRVLEAVRALHYVPHSGARSLAVKRHQALGLVLPEITGFYYPELLTGFESLAAERRLSVVLLVAGLDGTDLVEPLAAMCSRVDGLAVMNGAGLLSRQRITAIDRHTPIVLIGSASSSGDVVTTGSRENARLLTAHLLAHGRRRPVFAGDPALAPDARARWEGFAAALDEAGLAVPEPVLGGFHADHGELVGQRIADGAIDCDAVVCVNDDVALGLCLALRRRGLGVPGDVAVTGWDDNPATRYTTPGITTVAQPVRELGRAAAMHLLARLDGDRDAIAGTELPTRLVVRGSCGCPEFPSSRAPGPGAQPKENR